MALDLKTLFFTVALVLAVAAVTMGVLYRLHGTIPGPKHWFIGKIILSLSILPLFIRDHVPLIFSGGVTAVLQYVAIAFILVGHMRFSGRAVPKGQIIALVSVLSVSLLATFYDPDALHIRLFVHDAALALLHLLGAWVLLTWGEHRNISQRVCGVVFLLHGLFTAGVAMTLVFVGPQSMDLMRAGPMVAVLLLEVIAQNILNSACLVLMVSERLHHQLQHRIRDLDEARRAAETAHQEQRNFLAMVSHEFRSPLSIIDAAATVTACNLDPADQESQEELQRIRRVVVRLTNLVEACLADDWLGSSVTPQPSEAVMIYPIVERLAAEYDTPLYWTGARDVRVWGEPTLLPIAISSLLDNARKYGRTAQGNWLFCGTHREPGETELWIRIDVHDDGPGIPADQVSRIMEKYYRAPTTLGKPGAGLGLYLVRRIVVLHGGYVAIEQQQGTTFSIRLPVLIPSR